MIVNIVLFLPLFMVEIDEFIKSKLQNVKTNKTIKSKIITNTFNTKV